MTTTAANNKTTARPKTTATRTAQTETGPVQVVRQSAERALDVPVGAALLARERVTDAVEPWTSTRSRASSTSSSAGAARRVARPPSGPDPLAPGSSVS